MNVRIPDAMLGYATYELAQRMTELSAQQRAAIGRIVQHCYLDCQPLAALLRGTDKICSETTYYRNGKMDAESGRWLVAPGWTHQPAFTAALEEAARLALQAQTRAELHAAQSAIRRARLAAEDVIYNMVGIVRTGQNRDSIAAGRLVLDVALRGLDAEPSDATGEAADWWKAANDD